MSMHRGIVGGLVGFIIMLGCDQAPLETAGQSKKAEPFTSAQATLLDFSFRGELLTSSTWSLSRQAEEQVFFTVGQLNGERSVGRLDRLSISIVDSEAAGDGLTRVVYDATLPVAWGSKTNLPQT